MLDTRREVLRLLGKLEFRSSRALLKIAICLALAAVLALLPNYAGLTDAARWTLFILILGAGLWITEAIPSFSVALLIIALEIMILGKPGGVFAKESTDWEMFVQPWASPIMWLFLGGLVLGEAAQVTGLDRLFSRYVLKWFGNTPGAVLLGSMGITFLFSMFMSNTATTAMMMSVIAPIVVSISKEDPFAKALVLGIPVAANVGGMGTIIGSPPNAITAGILSMSHPIDFTRWMLAGIPPALVLFAAAWLYLRMAYSSRLLTVDISGLDIGTRTGAQLPLWKRLLVMPVFVLTVILWMTSTLHHIPTAVISFIPITIFAIAGIITIHEIRHLNWDVLLLLAGGLSLGIAVQSTGLANWLVDQLPTHHMGQVAIAFFLSYVTALLSNFMSNTAAANILVPIGMAVAVGFEPRIVVPMALGASTAMCLPISTPPNAIAFASGRLATRDFLKGGLLMGLLGPAIAALWCLWLFK
ncbi:MAG: DASS family sodium-coupled anion symporter [Fidelibacterota bacterium]|nr:MAG: DASS family sodium-coupled anion symporter [Candidatus Neomarinimicrobiota bacterium]